MSTTVASRIVGGVSGITSPASTPCEDPEILICGDEKVGKSFLATSLINWPSPGKGPLILALDRTGPDSCRSFCQQYNVDLSVLKVEDQSGISVWDKTDRALRMLNTAFAERRSRADFPFSAVVVDCASTLVDLLFQESMELHPLPQDQRRSNYGEALEQAKQVYWRLRKLHVPVIWLAWLRQPEIRTEGKGAEKRKIYIQGGPNILGQFRSFLAGKVQQICLLHKKKVGQGVEGADQDGYLREIRTRPCMDINVGGRYQAFLPDPAPCHLGYLLSCITGAQPK